MDDLYKEAGPDFRVHEDCPDYGLTALVASVEEMVDSREKYMKRMEYYDAYCKVEAEKLQEQKDKWRAEQESKGEDEEDEDKEGEED
ncbi:hypothetical protein BCR34DRAFT_607906 [Clohesyomyces aquaticus]|uniref:Uncharacterized protein n=1 Tax=Clohesyomyces aquaticus TaxID=1231657 RepID=A0A1Y1YC72_9PLEO|nr:hypothetical protein BCR34DRAFT_607906 [Clohesyomyces aquaticus]